MKIVNLNMTIGIGNNPFQEMIYYKKLIWPDICPCCGEVNTKLKSIQVAHKVEIYIEKESQMKSSFLEWSIPSCNKCLLHYRIDSILFTILLIIPSFLWVVSGIVLFAGGYAENQLAIMLWMIGFIVSCILSYVVRKITRIIIRKSIMKESCCDYSLPVSVTSRYPIISLHIKSDLFADKLIRINK